MYLYLLIFVSTLAEKIQVNEGDQAESYTLSTL